jgi:GntR family transcriptional regulator/MocR family aminotransferase
MLGLILDRSSALPLGRQIAAHLRALILEGRLEVGTKLPSSRELAREWGVARNVVTEVFEQLTAEGYLTARVGSGTVVSALKDLSGRSSGTPPRPVRPVPREKAGDTVDFSSACGTPDPESFPLARWKSCLTQAWDGLGAADLGYGDIRGDLSLRTALATWLFRTKGVEAEPEQIFLTSGITQSLDLVAGFLRGRMAGAVVEDPALTSLCRVVQGYGLPLTRIPVDGDGLQTTAVPRSEKGRLWVLAPSHQFPTGALLRVDRRLDVLERVRTEGGWVFEDDYDGDLRFRGSPVPPLVTLAPSRVIYAGTFNKSMFSGIRTGYMVVPPSLVSPLILYRESRGDWGALPVQKALSLFITEGFYDRRLATLKKLYQGRRALIDGILEQKFGAPAALRGTGAGSHGWMTSPAPLDPGVFAGTAGVRVTAVGHYSKDPEPWRGAILVGWGNLDAPRIERGLARLFGGVPPV